MKTMRARVLVVLLCACLLIAPAAKADLYTEYFSLMMNLGKTAYEAAQVFSGTGNPTKLGITAVKTLYNIYTFTREANASFEGAFKTWMNSLIDMFAVDNESYLNNFLIARRHAIDDEDAGRPAADRQATLSNMRTNVLRGIDGTIQSIKAFRDDGTWAVQLWFTADASRKAALNRMINALEVIKGNPPDYWEAYLAARAAYAATKPPPPGRLEDIASAIYADGITATDATIRVTFKQAYSTTKFGAWFGADPNNLRYVEETYGSPHSIMYYNATKWFGGCQPNTTYYYRFFAYIGGVHYVSDLKTFKTLPGAMPQGRLEDIASAIYADGITRTDATIRTTFKQAYSTTKFGAWFGADPNNLRYVEETYGSPHSIMYYNAIKWFGGCQPGTTYYYRFFADIGGVHYVSDLKSFVTLAAEPLNTAPLENIGRVYADGITQTDATIRTQFNQAYSTIKFGAWFGTNPDAMLFVEETYGSPHSIMYYNATKWFGGCQPGTTYYYRFFADIGNTHYVSSVYSLVTQGQPPATGRLEDLAADITADGITQTDATIRARFLQPQAVTCYGAALSADPGKLPWVEAAGTASMAELAFNAQASFGGCQPATTYHYRFFAVIGGVRYESQVKTFTTLAQEPVITSEILTENITIPFETERRANPGMLTTEPERVVQSGKDGIRQKQVRVTYHDGVEFSRELISDQVDLPAVPQIIEYGTLAPGEDSITIMAITPNRFPEYEVPTTFTVTVAYTLLSRQNAAVIVAFNSEKADSYTYDKEKGVQMVTAGSGTLTFTCPATPRAWGTPYSPNGGFQGGLEAIAGDIFGPVAALINTDDGSALVRHKVNLSQGTPDPLPKPGDANDDKAVDIMDLVSIIDYIVSGTRSKSMANADANGDGVVDIMDLVWIIEFIVGG